MADVAACIIPPEGTDPADWARSFANQGGLSEAVDHATLESWFDLAIEAGRTAGRREVEQWNPVTDSQFHRQLSVATLSRQTSQEDWWDDHRKSTDDPAEANLIGSELVGPFWDKFPGTGYYHAPVIDLDMECHLVPSSTPGHFHLYIEREVPREMYFDMIDAMARAGIVEGGYAAAMRHRGQTHVRLPGVHKSAPDPENPL